MDTSVISYEVLYNTCKTQQELIKLQGRTMDYLEGLVKELQQETGDLLKQVIKLQMQLERQ